MLVMPEHRATEAMIDELLPSCTARRRTEVTATAQGLGREGVRSAHPVQVTADLYGELKGLLGPQCLG